MKKAYIFLADGFEEIEALATVDLLRRAGIEAPTVSINGTKIVTGNHNIPVTADFLFSEVKGTLADAAILPGGMPGTLHLEECEELMEMVLGLYEAGSYVAAICAAPSIFAHIGLLEGKKATCYPKFEDHLSMAEFVLEPVVADGRIITSRGAGTAIDFALKIIEVLVSKEKADEVAETIIYRQ